MPTYPPNVTLTPRLGLPRPGLDDIADGPDAFNDLTDVLDPLVAGYASGTTAARPAGYAGQFYWNTDTKTLDFHNGTAWGAASGAGTVGSNLAILDVGMAGQRRAGRQLTVADFTSLGLAQPVGLWNLSDLSNLGSDGRALANKGAVPFGVGINGLAATSAVFAGSASQALYIVDSGAADPFRIRTGSWGCWFRTAKRATQQILIAKAGPAAGSFAFFLSLPTSNVVSASVYGDGTTALANMSGVSDACDDRWHFAVGTTDGSFARLYVDGVLEAASAAAGTMFASAGPLNIGAFGADSGAAAGSPHYGRVDEAFVSADVLTEDQIRALYAARLTHTLGVAPTRVSLNVRRARKGAPLAPADFTTQPLRLHNFTAGALTDQGSGNVALTNAYTTLIVAVAGADGTPGGAYSFSSAHQGLTATDAGLPAALAARSYGCWFKTTTTNNTALVSWGSGTGTASHAIYVSSSGAIVGRSNPDDAVGPFVGDGQWHFVALVEDNAAGDGVRRKLYLDGRLVGGSTVLNPFTLTGANRFRIGAWADGSGSFTGQIDGAFVTGYALGQDDVARLWAKGAQALAPSPKNAGDHVEAIDATSLLAIFDTLESQHTVDVGVAA